MVAADPRIFLPWSQPVLPQVARVLADTYADAEVVALDRALVVLPGARAGRRLKELLIEEAARRGLRLVPPRIITAGALPEMLHVTELPLAEPSFCRRLWAHELRALPEDSLRELFPRAPARHALREWLQLAREVERLHSLVSAGGHTFGDVAASCDDSLLYDDAARWTVLARVQEGYARALASAGRADRDLARLDALRGGAVACDADLWLVALSDMPTVLRGMVHVLLGGDECPVRVLVHAPDELAAAFDPLGSVRPDVWRAAHIEIDDAHLHVVGHPSNQAAAAVAALARLDGRYAADEITVGVPDEEVVPYLEQGIGAHGIAARYAGGSPIERSAPVHMLDALAEYIASGSPDSLAALVRHPDLAAWMRTKREDADHPGAAALADTDALLTPLDRFLTERLPSRLHAAGDAAGGRDRSVVAALMRLLGTEIITPLRGRRLLAQWMEPVLALLADIYGAGQLNRRIPAERQLIRVFSQIRDAAAAYVRIPEPFDDTCDVATAMRVLLDDLRGGRVPAESDDAAIDLLGWLEMHLDDAPVAILTGMNEPYAPEAVNADAFLPNSLRTRLRLEDNDQRYARYAYQLTAMLQSREHVTLIAGRRTVLGDPLRPSRLLLTGSGAPLARRVLAFLDGDSATTVATVTTPPHGAAARSAFVLPPEPVLRLPPIREFSVTDFRALLSDPYLFALERALRLRPVDDSARELDGMRFGSFAHDVLQQFGTNAAASSAVAHEVAAALDELLDTHARTTFGSAPLPAVRVQVEQLRLRLRTYAHRHAERVADGWRIVAVELATVPEGVPFEVDGETVRLRGRIDRIDYNAARNEWAVLDYKTGDNVRSVDDAHCNRRGRNIHAWRDLQLPLYRHLLGSLQYSDGTPFDMRTVSGREPGPVALGYVSICGEPDAICIDIAPWTDDELAHADETARTVVRAAARGEFTYEPSNAWLEPDMEFLLGYGRLVLAEDDEELVDA